MENDGGYGGTPGAIVNSNEYLAQIAPPAAVQSSPWPRRLGIIAAILALLAGAFYLVFTVLSDPRPEIRALAGEVDLYAGAAEELSKDFNTQLRTSATRTLNGEFATFLASFRRDFRVILESTGGAQANPGPIEDLLAPVVARFERDYLLGTLDRNFPGAVVYQIDLLRAKVNGLEYRLENVGQRQLLRQADDRLRIIRQQYLDLDPQ